jgi:polysaccharide export outer membrane protein
MSKTKKTRTPQRRTTPVWLLALAIWMATAALLVGCAALPPLPQPTLPAPPLEVVQQRQPSFASPAYTISPEDVLRIMVQEHADLSLEVAVAPDGTFAYPFLGKVQAAGLTVPQLEGQMIQRLANGYLVDPQLAITVAQYRNRHVYLLGAVRTPGVYPLRHNATLVELLTQAGGPTPEAGWYALVVRAADGQNGVAHSPTGAPGRSVVRHIDLEKLMVGQMVEDIGIESGDTIYVPSAFFFVAGEVQRPGRYPLERHTTVQKALVLAGGFGRFAARKRLLVKRLIDGQPQEFQVSMDDLLQAEDILVVPESAF